MNDWEKYMTDFIGDEMLSIDVPANKVGRLYLSTILHELGLFRTVPNW